MLYFIIMLKTIISSKGQTSVPTFFRNKWKTKAVFWQEAPDGSAIVQPVPDVNYFYGIANPKGLPRDPLEREKAWDAIAEEADRQGPL